ncbi:hypothetical protein PGB90_004381 [Kerria lacca]
MTNNSKFICRVSSTLNNDHKNYGKKNMFDGNEETCWNSSEGSPQWIEILFKNNQQIKGLEFQFQGGFVGQKCLFQFYKEQPEKNTEPDVEFSDFYPEDINSIQIYNMKSSVNAKFIRLIFNESTDFYGRVIIYLLRII